jgi:[acyl-carrier-protein] S-malonyltransferase
MNYAVLFSGQASQHANMLPWLEPECASQPVLALMAQHLGENWRAQLNDPATRTNNAFAQVLITGTALAAWSALASRLPTGPAVVAGYSVGELPALVCAGVVSASTALDLADLRARLMDLAVAGKSTGLMSVSGMTQAQVMAACEGLGLECAIHIGPLQVIFAGSEVALLQAVPLLTAQGALCQRLAVRVASHSTWMKSAAEQYQKALSTIKFDSPVCPLALNASGTLSRQPVQIKQAMSLQLAHTVQWSACMDAMAERQVACVLEVGAGSALSRMWNEHHPQIPARALEDFRQPQGAADWVIQRCDSGCFTR